MPGMHAHTPVRALLFDMDGTLVDTETQTDRSIEIVLARHGVPGYSLPVVETRGRTWTHVASLILAQTGIGVPAERLCAELIEQWNLDTAVVKPLPGAVEALRAAAGAGLRLAIVSSSPRAVIGRIVDALGVGDLVGSAARVGGDEVRRGKPDPECFLAGARLLGATPAESLVFEDSNAGLLAARAAGMRSVFITCCASDVEGNRPLAALAIEHYAALPASFWRELAAGRLASTAA
jgi:HAD superfamily hydrolase (TIGR01509 family)